VSYNELISTAFGFFAPFIVAIMVGAMIAIGAGYFEWAHDALKIADTHAWWGFWLFVVTAAVAIVVLARIFFLS